MIEELKKHILKSIDRTNERLEHATVTDSIKIKSSISTAKKIYSFIEGLEKGGEESDSILIEADNIVNKQIRGYGHVVKDFEKITELLNMIISDCEKSAMQCGVILPSVVAKTQIAVELCRESIYHKRGNLTDLCGYSEILNKIEDASSTK